MFNFVKISKRRNLRNLEEIFYLASEKLTPKMEEILHYIHTKFSYCRECETNFTRSGPTSLSHPCSASREIANTLGQENLT